MIDIWKECESEVNKTYLAGILYRTVESQEQIATMEIVDNLDEQSRLEELIDLTKPAQSSDTDHLHFLLATPFRYPPLPYGSRFGQKNHRGIFYGSTSEKTALAEDTYYRLLFRFSSETLKKRKNKTDQRTLITAQYNTENGLELHQSPFNDFRATLRDPVNYQATQKLGLNMRLNDIMAFEFVSARDIEEGTNVGLFSPYALTSEVPITKEGLIIHFSEGSVMYRNTSSLEIFNYSISDYLVDGKIPLPAN